VTLRSSIVCLLGTGLLGMVGLICCVDAGPVRVHAQEVVPPTTGRGQPGRNSHDSLGLGPVPDAAAAKLGEPLYKQNCSVCHGETARGGEGPNLVRSVLVLHDEKGEEIGPLVKNGRVEAGMPAFPNLSETQRYDISEYIHLQIELAANRGLYTHADTLTSGDVEKGKAFFAANCAGCHSATGDLAKIGSKHPQPAEMLVRIVWPSTRGPRQATVITPGGEKLTGTLVHYDDFETTIRSTAGATTSWPTDSIKVEIPDKLSGHRALLPKYSDDDLHNLTKYLLTLK
jgi:cytochrome c oxidase cbb3-type subunit III